MSRIEDIFLLARDSLNDQNAQRWSDETLFRNLRMAIKDIATKSHIFKNQVNIALRNGISVYELPAGLLRVSHMTYANEQLPLVTSGWMLHNASPDWRTDVIEVPRQCLKFGVFDEIKRQELALYPRPFGSFEYSYSSLPTPYGIVTDIEEYDQLSYYGAVADIQSEGISEAQTSYYGVISDITEVDFVTVYYSECPRLPYVVTDTLPIDESFDSTLKFFITGMALRNDVDQMNRQIASEEFALYERDLEALIDLADTDSVAAPWFESHYNPMG